MMKIFQRYIAKGFWGPFLGSLAVFTALLLLGNIFGHLYVFTKGEVSIFVFLKYIICQAPYFMVKIMPISTLLAVLMALGKMVASGEWKAGMAGGWRPFDMIKPLLLCAAMAGLIQFAVQETIAPELYLESEHIFRRDIRGRDDWARLVVNNVSFSAGEGKFITCKVFDGRINTMHDVMLSEYSEGKIKYSLRAVTAVWAKDSESAGKDANADGHWEFRNAVETKYGNSPVPAVKRYKTKDVHVPVGPGDLILENLVPDGINLKGLNGRISKLKLVGAPSVTERTLMWCKLSAPFANLIMALIGAAMALMFTGNSRFYSYGLAIGIGFLFWASLVFSQEVGNAEIMSPAMAGISPIALFGLFSAWILKKARAF